MKIAFISQYFFPDQFSNTAIARDLIARGHHVHVFTCVPNYPAGVFFEGYSNASRREEDWEGMRISRVYTFARGRTAAALLLNYLAFPVVAIWTLSRRRNGRRYFEAHYSPEQVYGALECALHDAAGLRTKRRGRRQSSGSDPAGGEC